MGRFNRESLARGSARAGHHRKLPRGRRPALARAFALLTLVAALGGCTNVGPLFVKPDTTLESQWITNEVQVDTAKAADAAWWRAFNDPVLDRLIEMAWQQNLTVETAGLRVAQARAQLAMAVGQKYPQVQAVNASASAVGISRDAPNIANFDRNFSQSQGGFDAAWEADFWGRYQNMQRGEAARYFNTVADYDTALVSLSAEVARTYAVIRTYETLISLARKNVELQQEGYRIAEVRFRRGATSQLDVTQAMTLLESTRVSIPRYQLNLEQSQNALGTLVSLSPGRVREILGSPKAIPVAPTTVAIGMPAELLRRRPDIRSAEYAALEQSAKVGVATSDLYPRISLAGSLGLMTAGGGGLDLASNFYNLGPRLFLPILDYDRTRNNIRIEDARLQQLLVNYRSIVQRAQQEAQDGVVGFVRAHQVAGFARNATTSAQRSTDLAFTQYREGAVDFQRVIEAMRSLLVEETTLAQAQSDIATNLIALYKALGGGWELHQGQPVITERARTEMEQRTSWGDLLQTLPPPETLNTQSR